MRFMLNPKPPCELALHALKFQKTDKKINNEARKVEEVAMVGLLVGLY